jgi:WD40 repeat protein
MFKLSSTVALVIAISIAGASCLSHAGSTSPVARRLVEFSEKFTVATLAFNGDDSELAVNFMVHDDGLHIWKWQSRPPLLQTLENGHNPGDGLGLIYSPDGLLLAVKVDNYVGNDTVIRIWNAKSGKVAHDIVEPDRRNQGQCQGIAFTPDGKLLIRTATRNIHDPGDQIFAYRTDTWELAWSLNTLPFQPALLAMSPDGKILAVSGYDMFSIEKHIPLKPKIVLLDVNTRQIVRDLPRAAVDVCQKFGHQVEFARDIGMAAAPDGQIAARARESGAVLLTRDLDFGDVRRYPPDQ